MRDRVSAGSLEALVLVALAVAPWTAAPWGAIVAVAGVAGWHFGRAREAPRGPRIATALLIAGAAALVLVALTNALRPRGEAASAALRESFVGFWEELAEDADRAASELGSPPFVGEARGESFDRLRRAAASARAAGRTYLVFDPFGDLEVWWGPGLLVDLRAPVPPRDERGAAQAALSATPYVTRRLASRTGRDWTLVVGESFHRDGPPPTRFAESGRWRAERWGVAMREQEPELLVAGAPELRPRFDRGLWRALGGCSVALGVAVLALWRRRAADLLAHPARWRADAEAAVGVALAVAAAAVACGARPGAALAAGAAALAAGAAGLAGGRGGPLPLRVGVAGAIGPALLWFAARQSADGSSLTSELFGDATGTTARLAVSLCVVAAWWWASETAPEAQLAPRRQRRALAGAALLVLVALAAAGQPVAAAVALAAAGVLAALGLARDGRPRGRWQFALALLATLSAGAAWVAGEQLAAARRSAELLPRLLPPPAARLAELREEVQRGLRRLTDLQFEDETLAERAPSDLAFAIWRSSPLARRDGLSSLTVVPPDAAPVSFSFGLPIDADGRLDLSPARWVDLVPAPWLARRVEGDLARLRLDGSIWQLRWSFVPRPGFGDAAGAAVGEGLADVLRAGSRRGPLPELPSGSDAVIYGADGQPLATPWMEGTPVLERAWIDAPADAFGALTPHGEAQVTAAAGDEIAAAIFRREAGMLGALERAGNLAVGAWMAGLLAALPALFLSRPRGAAGAWARGLLGSYSQRLVVVFSGFLLLPLGGLYAFVATSTERRLRREQETAALDALRSSQRILGEYVLSLDPGFGVGTALDDRLLEWLARVVRSEIHLYWGSEIYASSKRDLFAAGLAPRRLAGEVWQRIHVEGDRVARRSGSMGSLEAQEIYAPLEIPGLPAAATKLVLAAPQLTQLEELAAESSRLRRRALLVTLALAALLAAAGGTLARRFARPIEAIVAGTRRIAEGAPALGYRPDERELEALAEAIDSMAMRIAEARERLMVEKGLVERIVENVTAGVVGLDREGRVLFANRLARSMLCAVPGAVLAATLENQGLTAAREALRRAAVTAGPVATRVTLGDAERDWTLVRVPLPGGTEPSELVVVEDVTDVARAQRLDAWAAMARIIAHEVKNPLTPIRLSAEHLREAWARDREHFSAVFERCTSNILAQVEELRRTANEFSVFSEIPRIEPHPGDLRAALIEILEAYRAAPPPGVAIELRTPDEPVEASFDRRLLGRAVRNLVENAIRASSAGGAVVVRLDGGGEGAVITVSDSGPGVPPELLSRVVEPYFSTHAGGTGLGLPIARRVVEEHGGSFGVRNLPAGGFEVTLTIPRR